MKSINVFFDDERICPSKYIAYRTSNKFINFLITNNNSLNLSFDHDIGEHEKSGYEVIKYLLNNHPEVFNNVNNIQFHTNNMIGGKNMYMLLMNAKKFNIINCTIDNNVYQCQQDLSHNTSQLIQTGYSWMNI